MAYFSNSSEGEILEHQCGHCPLGGPDGDGPCPIVHIQMIYNYDQLDDGQEKLKEVMSMLVDDNGVCQIRSKVLANITVHSHDDADKPSSLGGSQ